MHYYVYMCHTRKLSADWRFAVGCNIFVKLYMNRKKELMLKYKLTILLLYVKIMRPVDVRLQSDFMYIYRHKHTITLSKRYAFVYKCLGYISYSLVTPILDS